MTKEELYKKILGGFGVLHAHKIALDEFFKDKVIIQCGENRHQYADVLHEWLEGAECELQNHSGTWSKIEDITVFSFRADNNNCALRIKPKEPIWEWQWCRIYKDNTISLCGYHTDKEAQERSLFEDRKWVKIQETKRERKQ